MTDRDPTGGAVVSAIPQITRELLREWNACWSDDEIAARVPVEGVTLAQVLDSDIDHADKVWVWSRAVAPATARLTACDWAERACRCTDWTDGRSLCAIDVARRYALGAATKAELFSAWAAAREAARAAAWSAEAAEAAAAGAAGAAGVAGAAAEAAAARVAEEAAERSKQLADMRASIEREALS